MRLNPALALLILPLFLDSHVLAEKPNLSPTKLHEIATHVVVAKVQAIYHHENSEGNWKYDRSVAEIRVDKIEKGTNLNPGQLVYARYWTRSWQGAGRMPPSTTGHRGLPAVGDTVRVYLARNAYDGFSRSNNDGGFNVIGANGFEEFKLPQQRKETRAGTKTNSTLNNSQSKIQPKPGVFRFVLCRASNIKHLAISRRDSFMKKDTVKLLSRRINKGLSKFKKELTISKIDELGSILGAQNTLEKIAQLANVTSESIEDGDRVIAAFCVSEIQHADIEKELRQKMLEAASALELSDSEQDQLLRSVISQLSVGWGGNQHYQEMWKDPSISNAK